MTEKTNCPNCGAPIAESKCPYCGTVFYDMTVLDMENPGILRIKTPMGVIEGWMYVGNVGINIEPGDCISARSIDGMIHRTWMEPNVTVNLELHGSRIRTIKEV